MNDPRHVLIDESLKLINYLMISIILTALFIDVILKIHACHLCYIERIPYYICIFIITSYFVLKARLERFLSYILFFLTLIFLWSILQSLYHVSLEHKWIAIDSNCTSTTTSPSTVSEFYEQLHSKSFISCDKPEIFVFGMSLTTLNFISSLFIFIAFTNLTFFSKTGKTLFSLLFNETKSF